MRELELQEARDWLASTARRLLEEQDRILKARRIFDRLPPVGE